MRINFKVAIAALAMMAQTVALTSCDNNDDPKGGDEGSKVELPADRMYVLNEGTYGLNNSNIAFFAPKGDADPIDDIYFAQNGVRLGDNAMDMIKYDGSMFVAVYGSNYLVRLNAAAVEEKRVLFAGDPELQGGVRYITADGGYVYATFYGGIVAKIDARTLEIVAKLKTEGANIEGISAAGGTLYVADSYEMSFNPDKGYNEYFYRNRVIAIDLKSFTVKEHITVAENPNRMLAAGGKVFLISNDYSQESYPLQIIDPAKGNSVERIGYATEMSATSSKVYFVDSRADYTVNPYKITNYFSSYDLRTGKYSAETFLKNAPEELSSASIYMISVDDRSGDIYIGTTFYTAANGNIYRFKADGTFVGKLDSGGQNPRDAVFFD